MNLEEITVRLLDRQRATLQFVTLDEIRIGFRFRHTAIEDRWYLWLIATDNAVIAGPLKMLGGVDVFEPYKYDPRVPPGQLFTFSADREPPTAETIDGDAKVYYRSTVA